jgi:two-component system NtrC family response regulator
MLYEKLEGIIMTGHRADILVIDDELTICRNCQKALREEGYDVSIALNGYEGLKRFRKEDFDVAIVDLKMPGIDGMEVVKTMKMEQPATEVIIRPVIQQYP